MISTDIVSNCMEGPTFLYAKFLSVQISATLNAQDLVMRDGKLVVKCWFLCLVWIRLLNSGFLLPKDGCNH